MKALIINCSPVRTGATAEIAKLVSEQLSAKYSVKSICIDDYSFSFCKGCRSCHNTAKCVMSDAIVIENIMNMMRQILSSLFLHHIGLIFRDNLRHSLTDVLHGAIHMSHMHQLSPERKDTPLL